MKKIFTLVSASVCAVAAMAASYTGTVNVGGTSSAATLQVNANADGTYAVVVDGVVNVTGAAGNDNFVYYSNGSTTVKVRMSGSYAAFDGTVNGTAVSFSNVGTAFQLPNSDFEAWTASSGEAQHWHGFKSAKGSLASMASSTFVKSTDVRSGATGTYSAQITSAVILGICANGTMTTGQLNAESTTAADVSNHSEMDAASTATDGDGNPFYMACPARPDALKTWIKYSQGKANSSYPYATISTVIFDATSGQTYYQDPQDKTYTNVVATAKNSTISTCDWTQLTVPFTYETVTDDNKNADAILVTVSTNATPGKGSSSTILRSYYDNVWVDDMELVYNYGLSNVTYGGTAVSNGAVIDNVVVAPVASDFGYTSAGAGSLSGVVIAETPVAWVATVYSTAADLAGSDVVTVTFNKPTVTVAQAIVAEENVQMIVDEAVVAANKDDLVYVTDNNGNWVALNVADADLKASLTEGSKASKFIGTLSNADTNPVLNVTYVDAVAGNEEVAYTTIDLAHHFTANPNGIYYVVGWIDHNGKLRAYSGDNGEMGQSLVINSKYVPEQTFTEHNYYKMYAVFTINEAWTAAESAPARMPADDAYYFHNYTIYPLTVDSSVTTAVEDLNGAATVSSVRYYNLSGQQFDTLQPGVNVVVKTLSNGATQVEKVIK